MLGLWSLFKVLLLGIYSAVQRVKPHGEIFFTGREAYHIV